MPGFLQPDPAALLPLVKCRVGYTRGGWPGFKYFNNLTNNNITRSKASENVWWLAAKADLRGNYVGHSAK